MIGVKHVINMRGNVGKMVGANWSLGGKAGMSLPLVSVSLYADRLMPMLLDLLASSPVALSPSGPLAAALGLLTTASRGPPSTSATRLRSR